MLRRRDKGNEKANATNSTETMIGNRRSTSKLLPDSVNIQQVMIPPGAAHDAVCKSVPFHAGDQGKYCFGSPSAAHALVAGDSHIVSQLRVCLGSLQCVRPAQNVAQSTGNDIRDGTVVSK